MKKIIKDGQKNLKTFKCIVCDTEWESDEYKQTILNSKKLYLTDECPKCLTLSVEKEQL